MEDFMFLVNIEINIPRHKYLLAQSYSRLIYKILILL
jgi:hypothetical protein